MQSAPSCDAPEADGSDRAISHVRIKNAGGKYGRFVLVADYAPRKGHKKTIQSNHVSYGMSWATREQISESDKKDFVSWIDTSLGNGGGSTERKALYASAFLTLQRRTSLRLNDKLTCVLRDDARDLIVERAVAQCVCFLVHNVVIRARHAECGGTSSHIHFVPSKRKPKTKVIVKTANSSSIFCRWTNHITRRMLHAKKLTQRKRCGRSYLRRDGKLKREAASKAESDLLWLETHQLRLATICARQTLCELLPDGKSVMLALWGLLGAPAMCTSDVGLSFNR